MDWKAICRKLGGCVNQPKSRPEPEEPAHTNALPITVRVCEKKGHHKYSSTVVDIHEALATPENNMRCVE